MPASRVNRTTRRDVAPAPARERPPWPASARIMSHGGLPITASNPAVGSRVPSRSKNTSGNSSSQWKNRCAAAIVVRGVEVPVGRWPRAARRVRLQHRVGQRAERGRRRRARRAPRTTRAPEVRDPFPSRERASAAGHRGERPFLLAHLIQRVVRRRLEREAHRQRVAHGVADLVVVEERQLAIARRRSREAA